jgi:hypothetical protein
MELRSMLTELSSKLRILVICVNVLNNFKGLPSSHLRATRLFLSDCPRIECWKHRIFSKQMLNDISAKDCLSSLGQGFSDCIEDFFIVLSDSAQGDSFDVIIATLAYLHRVDICMKWALFLMDSSLHISWLSKLSPHPISFTLSFPNLHTTPSHPLSPLPSQPLLSFATSFPSLRPPRAFLLYPVLQRLLLLPALPHHSTPLPIFLSAAAPAVNLLLYPTVFLKSCDARSPTPT